MIVKTMDESFRTGNISAVINPLLLHVTEYREIEEPESKFILEKRCFGNWPYHNMYQASDEE